MPYSLGHITPILQRQTRDVSGRQKLGSGITYPRNHVRRMNDNLCLVIVCEQDKHLRVVGAIGIGNVRMKQLDVRIALCCFL